jgi:aminoglycoside 3-N-acetyltransferase
MSVAALGEDTSVVEDLGRYSIGKDSTFDKLRRKGGTKFLFLGARPSKCMTYVHYIENEIGVPYRYNRAFTGTITDYRETTRETYILFVRYRGVIPTERPDYQEFLIKNKYMLKAPCGNSFVYTVDERFVYETLSEILHNDIDYLLAEPYPRDQLEPCFEVHDMVAL